MQRTAMFFGAILAATVANAQTPESTRISSTPAINDFLRWELVTDGSSALGDASPPAGTGGVPNLTGADANFLFRLDVQPLLNYSGGSARRSRHGRFEVGFISAPRAVTAQADLANSEAVETLTSQGAVVGGTSESSATLSRQRAFTVGAEYNDNLLFGADGSGTFGELGGVVRFNFDAYTADDRFFEKDGITYIKVPSTIGNEGGYFRFEAAGRFRLSNGEMKFTSGEGGNVDDLLLIEVGYAYSGASAGVIPDVSTQHRIRWRFLATPRLDAPKDTERNKIKAILGIEFDQDLQRKGPSELRIFYGANVNLEAIFKS